MMKVENKTLKKLDRIEIANLGLYDLGIFTYKGFAKSRLKGLKTTLKSDDEMHYESEHNRWEVIKIVATNNDGVNEYAIRCFNKDIDKYEDFYPVLIGCDFMR